MSTTTDRPNRIHQGRNVKRFREMLGIKQEALALELGEDWHQKRVSLLETKEEIEPELLSRIANALKISEEAIKNFDAEMAVNVISNTFHQHAFINSAGTFNINPIEKWIEALDENKRLYERLIKSEQDKVQYLERILKGKE